jgi:Dolichyl-phosphate-mannose-protein mannosyltransferase
MVSVMRTIFQYFLTALPFFAFVELWALFMMRSENRRDQIESDWREAFLYSAILCATLAFVFTELLSLRSALRLWPLASCWALLIVTVVPLFLGGARLKCFKSFKPSLESQIPIGNCLLLFWIIVVLGTTALTALSSPPNNWDSMVYHMSRVAHWWTNNTVAFYPTHIQRQLYLSPLAEYIILQFFVLSGGSDRLANMVQWFCLGGCAIAASLITHRLGANRFTQFLTAFIVLTTPMAILQASSTQNDLVCAFLVTVSVYFLLSNKLALTGVSLGLAILTKATAGLFAFPFLLVMFFRELLSKRGWFKAATKVLLIGCLVLIFNFSFWLRNWRTFHNPLGYTVHTRWIQSQTLAPGPFISSLMRNLAIELVTPAPRISKLEENAILDVHKILGLDPNDPRNTFPQERFAVPTMVSHEDSAANPLQTALLIAATLLLLVSRDLRRSRVAIFTLCLWAGFILVSWRLSWQPWNSRLHTPFLVLASVPIAIFLNERRRRFPFCTAAIITALMVMSLFPLLRNAMRPVVTSSFTRPRSELYFVARPELRSCFAAAIEVLSRTSRHNVGLEFPEDQWEYPLWALARSKGLKIRFEHWDVGNATKSTTIAHGVVPDATIFIHDANPSAFPVDASVKTSSEFRPGREPGEQGYLELRSFDSKGAEIVDRIECKP